MDALSIAGTCVGLLGTIAALSQQLTSFVLIARDARRDVDGFSRELASLGLCVSMLKDETFKFPGSLQQQLVGVLNNCRIVIKDMEKLLKKHRTPSIGSSIKWSVADRDEVVRLRERLEAHKVVLEITLELASLTVVASVKVDTEVLREDTTAIKAELEFLKTQVVQLASVRAEPNFILNRFLVDTVAYTESVVDPLDHHERCANSPQSNHDEEREVAVQPANYL